jgi:hypothetical protein
MTYTKPNRPHVNPYDQGPVGINAKKHSAPSAETNGVKAHDFAPPKKNFASAGKTIPTQTHIAKSHELKQNNKPYDTRSEPSKKYKQNEEFEVNENLENILVHAWNKDAVNLRSALDAEMQSRISDHVDSMVADVSARLFVPANSTDNEG